jgi:hypothetical protein
MAAGNLILGDLPIRRLALEVSQGDVRLVREHFVEHRGVVEVDRGCIGFRGDRAPRAGIDDGGSGFFAVWGG